VFGEIDAGAVEASLIERQETAAGTTAEVDDGAGSGQVLLDKALIGLCEGGIADFSKILLGKEWIVEVLPQAGRDTGR
jgi:hypothetical protein